MPDIPAYHDGCAKRQLSIFVDGPLDGKEL